MPWNLSKRQLIEAEQVQIVAGVEISRKEMLLGN